MSDRVSGKGAKEGLRETEVAQLWQEYASTLRFLTTTHGRRVRVLYPGRPSSAAGPDFRDALLVTQGGQLLQGDVEVHLRQGDWWSHGHHRDPRYNGVILHAVLWPHGRETSLEMGTQVPVVALRSIRGRLGRRPGAVAAPGPGWGEVPLLSWYRRLPLEDVGRLLERAGDERFLRKSRRFGQALLQGSRDQVLYGDLLDGLGYSQNREPFQVLARALPWHTLRREALRVPPAERRKLLETLLLGSGGLLPHGGSQEDGKPGAEIQAYGRELGARWQRVGLHPAPLSAPWELFRVRPENHPLRRLVGVARLLEPHLERGLVRGLEGLLWEGDGAKIRARLRVPAKGPWAQWRDFHHPITRPAPALIGEGRARDLLVNVLLPFFHALGQADERAPLQARAIRLYHQAPLLGENAITREMRRRLLEPGSRLVRGARRQQGLIHLYRTFFTRQG